MGAKASSHTAEQASDGMVAGRKPTCDETEQCDGMVAGRKPTHDETEKCDGMVAGRKPTCDETEPCDGMVTGRKPTCDKTEQSSYTLLVALERSYIFVAAIDIGPSYTGVAFSFRNSPLKITLQNWLGHRCLSPTCVLLDPQKRFSKFGFEAEDKYKSIASGKKPGQDHREWFFFRRLYLTLFDKMNLQRQYMLQDESGKEIPALDVFSAAIGFLKDKFIETIQYSCRRSLVDTPYIRWVLTIPTYWTDAGSQFMREAANKTGIKNENLLIALQSEAALMYFRTKPRHINHAGKVSAFELVPGSKYMVFDASDGIVDSCVTVHKVEESGHSRRLYALKWGNQGGIDLDQAFRNFLASIVGNNIMDNWQMNKPLDYFELLWRFHIKMRSFRTIDNREIYIPLPSTLLKLFERDTNKKLDEFVAAKYQLRGNINLRHTILKISAATVKDIFKDAYESILKHFDALCCNGVLDNVSTILMVGKSVEYPMLQEMIKGRFKDKTIFIPEDNYADIAIPAGAVMLGHDATLIEEERCRKT